MIRSLRASQEITRRINAELEAHGRLLLQAGMSLSALLRPTWQSGKRPERTSTSSLTRQLGLARSVGHSPSPCKPERSWASRSQASLLTVDWTESTVEEAR